MSAPTGGGFVVLDVETTGLSPAAHRIVEIALVRTDQAGIPVDEWSSRINPCGPVGASHVHGIRAADVRDAPIFPDLIGEIVERMQGSTVVAHHAAFDLAFLAAEFTRAGWRLPELPQVCTLEASRHYLPDLPRRRLADCCWASGIPLQDAHSALGDARGTSILLRSYLDPAFGLPPLPEHVQAARLGAEVVWPRAATELGPLDVLRSPAAPDRNAVRDAAPAWSTERRRATTRAMGKLLDRFVTTDVVDDGPAGTALGYVEILAEALEDGEISNDERAALTDAAAAYRLDGDLLQAVHLAFLDALARHAVDDGLVSRAEKSEIVALAELLDVAETHASAALATAAAARNLRLGQICRELPEDWGLGEPLRVGDRIAFTGGDEEERQRQEAEASARGLRIASSVSRKTAALVTDGSFTGRKAEAAQKHGVRIIHPKDLRMHLAFLQPEIHAGEAPTGLPSMSVVDPLPDRQAPVDASRIRAWARENGFDVGVRGRLPAEVTAAYVASLTTT